jgi:hypothetical protein
MRDPKNETTPSAPIGELFTRVYIEPGAPLQDSQKFRNRLAAYVRTYSNDLYKLAEYIRKEGGLTVPAYHGPMFYYDFDEFINAERIGDLLNTITLIWRYFQKTYRRYDAVSQQASAWQDFVSRVLREENMAYTLDEKCGVHFFVDEEFERNRVSALKCLEIPRYAGVRKAFEEAHKHLDDQPPNTKASVRSAFEALEILGRLMDQTSENLNLKNKLKSLAMGSAIDATEKKTIGKIFDGLALMVDGLHNYRHGQPVPEPVAPSPTLAVFVISLVAAALRWLVSIDAKQQASGKPP